MALPKAPSPLTVDELRTLKEKFESHETPERQEALQEKFREKLENAAD